MCEGLGEIGFWWYINIKCYEEVYIIVEEVIEGL